MLTRLGHSVRVMHGPVVDYAGCEMLVTLHATRSGDAILRFRQTHPHRPILVALTGTDFFQPGDLRPVLDRSLHLANRILVLQRDLASQLPQDFQSKVRVIYQSFTPPPLTGLPISGVFAVCVLGHLRVVKDSLLAAKASWLLPAESRIRVIQVGGALESGWAEMAQAESRTNVRYQWLGELSRTDAVQVLSRCRVLVQSSLAEGGPSAVSEAVALGVPVLSTPTSGVVGLLGANHPGYFPFGDAAALALLLGRCETDTEYLDRLRQSGESARALVRPEAEMTNWRELMGEPGLWS